jgi:hypothetical protein
MARLGQGVQESLTSSPYWLLKYRWLTQIYHWYTLPTALARLSTSKLESYLRRLSAQPPGASGMDLTVKSSTAYKCYNVSLESVTSWSTVPRQVDDCLVEFIQ